MNNFDIFIKLPYSDKEDWINAQHKGKEHFKPTTEKVLLANRFSIKKASKKLFDLYGHSRPWVKQPNNTKYLNRCNDKRFILRKKFILYRKKKLTLQQIGNLFGIQKTRVWQIINDYRPWRKNV